MELLPRILRFFGLLFQPLRNPYTVLALLLALAGLLTALRGPEHLVWGCILSWMAAVLRLLHTQRELARKRPAARTKSPKSLELASLRLKPRAGAEPAER